MSVSEAAAFAAEFAEAVGDKRCNGHRKFFMSLLEFVSVLSHLRDGTSCHACTQADDIIFVMSHAQIYIEQRMTRKLKSSINYFRF